MGKAKDIVKQWEEEWHLIDEATNTTAAIISTFLNEHDLKHEFNKHLYDITNSDDNSDEVIAIAEMLSFNLAFI